MFLIAKHGSKLGLSLLVAAGALSLPACESGGHFTIMGYTTRPNYDCNIHTVYVPIFKNVTMRRNVEFQLTQAVVREIEAKTPFKVVSSPEGADTELLGKVISLNKLMLNRNQLNEVREAQTVLAVEMVWRDLRTGDILSQPAKRASEALPFFTGDPDAGPGAAPLGSPLSAPAAPVPNDRPVADPPEPTDPNVLPPPTLLPGEPLPKVIPVLVQSEGTFIPELGESLTTAEQQNVNRLAVQIVSMMEMPW